MISSFDACVALANEAAAVEVPGQCILLHHFPFFFPVDLSFVSVSGLLASLPSGPLSRYCKQVHSRRKNNCKPLRNLTPKLTRPSYLLFSLQRASWRWATLPVSVAASCGHVQRFGWPRWLLFERSCVFLLIFPAGAVYLLSMAAEALDWSRSEESARLGGQARSCFLCLRFCACVTRLCRC